MGVSPKKIYASIVFWKPASIEISESCEFWNSFVDPASFELFQILRVLNLHYSLRVWYSELTLRVLVSFLGKVAKLAFELIIPYRSSSKVFS